ncbi:MAG: FtsX-like permease family protein [Cyclobacteriaceae bacterium]|nr:FtsX-like permease family protein [Cyclobacteriaceae bacterium]
MLENIREGLRSIKANMLRSILTAVIVTFGITALVGSLTAVDGIGYTLNESLASLGANTFDIGSKRNRGASQAGIKQKVYKPLQMNEAQRFIDLFKVPAYISLSADLTGIAEVKHLSKKTNPNIAVNGINEDYMYVKSLNFEKGRNFSPLEIQYGAKTVILGKKVFDAIFDPNEDPLGKEVSFKGTQFRVIGVLVEKGNLAEDNFDNMVFIPVIVANQMASGRGLSYDITVAVSDATQLDLAMGEATGLMRSIRRDQIGKPNSFELDKSDTLSELNNLMSIITWVGLGIGFVTLLGSSIALMNIMLVSVTERTREVGVRKALGATPAKIRQQFIIEAIVVCLLGGILGIILGVIAGNALAKLMSMAFVLPWLWIFVGLVVCVGVGLLSGYYPANKASKLDPIESLRFE